jgi:hypothetical protein
MIREPRGTAMNKTLLGLAFALSLGLPGCQSAQPAPAADALDPALTQYVLSDVPKDIPNRCYLDFGGKVALIGYAIEPSGVAAPGSHVKLTLYWQSLSPLGPGWGLFTHLVIPRQPHRLLDGAGPLRKLVPGAEGGQRQALGPAQWERGKVYVDPLEFEIPANVRVPELTVFAVVWRDAYLQHKDGKVEDPKLAIPGLRLPVLSGPADDMQRGVVLHISTGLPAQMPPAPTPPAHAPGTPTPKPRGQIEANGAH